MFSNSFGLGILLLCKPEICSNDNVVSKERSYQLEKLLRHAKIKEIPNVGHAPYCEDAKTFNAEVENFFQ